MSTYYTVIRDKTGSRVYNLTRAEVDEYMDSVGGSFTVIPQDGFDITRVNLDECDNDSRIMKLGD